MKSGDRAEVWITDVYGVVVELVSEVSIYAAVIAMQSEMCGVEELAVLIPEQYNNRCLLGRIQKCFPLWWVQDGDECQLPQCQKLLVSPAEESVGVCVTNTTGFPL